MTMNDCISRQAVFDIIRSLTRWCVRSEDGKFNNVGLLYDDVMFGIDRLPSVTPTVDYEKCPYYESDILYDEEQNEEYDAGYCKYKPTERKVIEDIKAEIQKALDEDRATDTENAKVQAIALMWCLEIIDKHIGGDADE